MKLTPRAVLSVVRELRKHGVDTRPLAVAGARELVPLLARELRAGGEAGAVVENRVEDVAAVVWVGAADEAALRAADDAGAPIVAVSDEPTLPYVFAGDIVRVPRGQGFPVDAIADALAARLGDDGTALAARLPVLRPAVCRQVITHYARRNAVVAAAVFIPGVDLPVLTLNQIRMVLRIAQAHGEEVDRERAAELLAVVGAAFGFRTVARELLDLVPVAGWAVKGAVAYAGTKALGEAAVRYFEARG
jgi:uncharacterized protein (DUF697 family)